MTTTAHPADATMQALLHGFDTAAAPGGAYSRVLVGKKAAAWAIRLKSGQVRLILRTDAEPPKALSEGRWTEAGTNHSQFRIGQGDVKRGRALIEFAVAAVTPKPVPAAASKRPAKARLKVVKPTA